MLTEHRRAVAWAIELATRPRVLTERTGGEMDYLKRGKSGLEVSRLCLGCMSFGVPERGPHPWSLDEDEARPLIRQAIESGINFFDTANVYSDGTSEEIVGRA